MSLKDLFKTKSILPENDGEEISSSASQQSHLTYQEFGQQQAELLGGTPEVIHPALHSVYLSVKQKIAKDDITQKQRKAEIQSKIDVLEGEVQILKSKGEKKNEELKFEEHKIEEANNKIAAIRQNPSQVLGENGSPKVSFTIGIIIIAFLTLYLFVFYSSAGYSAFFKQFMPSDIAGTDFDKIAKAVFDAQALSKALNDGFTELIFIITLPAVFLGLGYLIHKFSTDKKTGKLSKIVRIGALVSVTFIFDAILAYVIDSNIYEVIRLNDISDNMPNYTLSMALTDFKFWMIIFSGFVVYIIWGFVFNFVMSEYYNLDKVRVAIEELEKKLHEYKTTCKKIKKEIESLDQDITKNEALVKTHKNDMLTTIVYKSDVQLEINNFVNGWLAYMSYKNFTDEEKSRVVIIKDAFLNSITNQFDTVKSIQINSNTNNNEN